MEAYNRWIIAGKPENEEGIPIVPPAQEEDTEDNIMPSTSTASHNENPMRTCTDLPNMSHESPFSSKQFEHTISPENHPKVCQHSQNCCLHLHNLQELAEAIGKVAQPKRSMEQIIFDRQRPQQAKKPGGRRVLGKGATVLTQDEVINTIEEREKEQKQKEEKKKQQEEKKKQQQEGKKKQGKKKVNAQKRKRKVSSETDDSSSISGASNFSVESRGSSLDVSLEGITVSDIEGGDEATGETDIEMSDSIEDANVAPSVEVDDDSINKYFAVIYTEPKKQYYWGKVTKVFSDDDELPVSKVEMTFLHRKTISSMPEKLTWQWPQVEDKHMVDVDYIFMGPCSPDILKNGLYKFNDVKANQVMNNI